MSGKPYPAGVTKVIELLDRIRGCNEEIVALLPKIERFEAAKKQSAAAQAELLLLLSSMDLDSTGNHGHVDRLAWFLAEMRRQVVAQEGGS